MPKGFHSDYGYVGFVAGKTMLFATEEEYIEYLMEVQHEERV